MLNNQSDKSASDDTQKQVEEHVRDMLGPFPVDAEAPKDTAPESAADIKSGDSSDELPGAPPVGTIITPTIVNEAGDGSSTEETPTPADEKPKDSAAKPLPADSPKDKVLPLHKESRLKRFFKAWWHNPLSRWGTILGILAICIAIALVPNSRYFVLNNAGVRSSASVTVLDDSTQLPLKNVQVSLAGASGQTNEEGQVKLEHLKLGKTQLLINKRAFAVSSQVVTLGWGSNPLGNFSIKPVGATYNFTVSDWLSGKPIEKAEATAADASALSNSKGQISLTIDPSEVAGQLSVTIKADGYRDETVTIDNNTDANMDVKMVPSRKEVFISNRSGKYDLYTSDVDGKNEKLVLAGTGLEQDDIVLAPHPTDEWAALVSTRVNVRNVDGFLLSTLTLVNLSDGTTFSVAQSERIQIVGWVGERLLFVQIAAGTSAASPARFRLMSYDYKTADKKELARANAFNDVIVIGDKVYLAPSSAYQTDPAEFISISADGSNKQTLLNQEVWNIFRDSFDTLDLSVGQDWYQYKLGDSNATKATQAPANPKSRLYVASPDGSNNLWIDQRDGKGVLLDYVTADAKDKTLQTQSGLVYPVRWLTDKVFIYRIHTDSETSDWVMSLDGGVARKIKDVYNTTGVERWYYY